ncbi:MAG: phosphatidylserine decarboxylase family protein [Pseudomonadota bacterium]
MIDNKLPVAREGLPFIVAFLALGLGAIPASWWLALPILALGFFSIWFFRDPDRRPPTVEGAVVSPADGTVLLVGEVDETRFFKRKMIKISIFMSIFNVHVNRAPLSGTVARVDYFPGKFFNASLDKASSDNEQNALVIQPPHGEPIGVVQIAGLVARRIVCWVGPGDEVVKGRRFGLIRFGSRLDVYLPLSAKTEVRPGMKVRAGESILGSME